MFIEIYQGLKIKTEMHPLVKNIYRNCLIISNI
jgi:hypothetical protein